MYNCLYSLRYTSWRWLTYLTSTNLLCNVNSSCLGLFWFKCVQAKTDILNSFKVKSVSKVKDVSFDQQSSWIPVIHWSHIKSGTKHQRLKIIFNCSMNTGLNEYMINYNYGLKQKSVSHLSSKCIAIAHHTKGRQFQQSSGKWKHTKYCFAQLCLTIVKYCKSKLLDVSAHFHLLFKPFSLYYNVQLIRCSRDQTTRFIFQQQTHFFRSTLLVA
ncbi:Hypothetical_protein [Hexamita inflata]|uniref:Hypothetical_protein n=1 Tax=Hexamita inflata TaxID=28002 RepID=A0AA86NSJ9_9EUKA|nr:Hypothetical protein HINF_LOCUS12412 [Hexamita inflata]